METAIPDTVTGGTTGGLSTGATIAIVFGVLSFFCGGGVIWKLKKAIRSWCQKCKGSQEARSGQRHTAVESGMNDSVNSTGEGTTEEPLLDTTELDHRPYQQAEMSGLSEGHGDGQAVHTTSANVALSQQQNFYDIYLVSSSKQTPHVEKIKHMCQSNEWIFTTPFNRKLGEPEIQNAEEAVLTCSHIVLIITEEDCKEISVLNKMIIEMAFAAVSNNDIGGKIIPIHCCDRKILPLRLRCLTGSTIDDDDLEDRMIKTIDKRIRKQRQVSGASDVAGVSDVAEGGDNASSAYSSAT